MPAATLAFVSTLSSFQRIAGPTTASRVEASIVNFIDYTFVNATDLTATIHELFDTSSTGIATFATLVAVFSLSGAFASFVRALDRAYGSPRHRPWVITRLLAAGLGSATILILASGAVVLTELPKLHQPVLDRIVTAILVMAVAIPWITTMFYLAPNQRTPWRYNLPGAVLTAVGWVFAWRGLGWYFDLTANSNEVQSSVGAILIFLTVLYALSVVLLVGAELNDVLAQRSGVIRARRSVSTTVQRLVHPLEEPIDRSIQSVKSLYASPDEDRDPAET